MYFPQFLVGMFTTSAALGAWAYEGTGSIWKAVAWAVIAAVLIQAGYFALVVRLAYGRRETEQSPSSTAPDATKRPVVPHQPQHGDGR